MTGVNGKIRRGEDYHLLQDCSKKLHKWLASRPDSLYVLRKVCEEIDAQKKTPASN